MADKFKRKSIYGLYEKNGAESPSSLLRRVFRLKGKDSREIRRSAQMSAVSVEEMCQFLECRRDQVRLRRTWWRDTNEGDVDGFDRFLAKECEVLRHFGRSRATYRLLCRGPDDDASVIDGLLFVLHKGTRLIVGIGPLDPLYYGESTTIFDILCSDKDKAVADEILRRFFSEECSRGKVIRAKEHSGFETMDFDEAVALEDVILRPETRRLIEANTLGLLEKRKTYLANGVPLKRGLLFVGPPGNGKTMVCKALAGLGRFTVFWMPPGERRDIAGTYARAVRLAPSIVLLEDVDLIAATRDAQGSRLGELLNSMDGLVRADGVITIATTNFPEALDKALASRPNRFDVRVPFENPDCACRSEMLRRFTARQGKAEGLVMETWAKRTEGFSGAQMRELCVQAVKNSLEAGRLGDDGAAVLGEGEFEAALSLMRAMSEKGKQVGFLPQG